MSTKISDAAKKAAVEYWFSLPEENRVKTEVAKKYGMSPQTLTRAIDANSQRTTAPEAEPVTPAGERKFKFFATNDAVSVTLNGETAQVSASDDRYQATLDALIAGDYETAWKCVNTKAAIAEISEGRVTVRDGIVWLDNFKMHGSAADRLINMVKSGAPDEGIRKFCRFFENLYELQDKRIIDELYEFIKHLDIELCDDGSFIAYKGVNDKLFDCYTNSIDNSVGQIVRMPRSMVTDDKNRTCAPGLHFGSLEYARNWARGGLVKVKVFPKNVVSVPVDYNGQKGRCCEYEVIEDISREL